MHLSTWTQKVRIDDQPLYLSVAEDNGKPVQVFIDMHKCGSALRGMLAALADTFTEALSKDVSILDLAETLRNVEFAPQGRVTGSPNVQEATSVLDYIAKELTATYTNGRQP